MIATAAATPTRVISRRSLDCCASCDLEGATVEVIEVLTVLLGLIGVWGDERSNIAIRWLFGAGNSMVHVLFIARVLYIGCHVLFSSVNTAISEGFVEQLYL